MADNVSEHRRAARRCPGRRHIESAGLAWVVHEQNCPSRFQFFWVLAIPVSASTSSSIQPSVVSAMRIRSCAGPIKVCRGWHLTPKFTSIRSSTLEMVHRFVDQPFKLFSQEHLHMPLLQLCNEFAPSTKNFPRPPSIYVVLTVEQPTFCGCGVIHIAFPVTLPSTLAWTKPSDLKR